MAELVDALDSKFFHKPLVTVFARINTGHYEKNTTRGAMKPHTSSHESGTFKATLTSDLMRVMLAILSNALRATNVNGRLAGNNCK